MSPLRYTYGNVMKQPDFHGQAILRNIFLLENIQGGIVYSDYAPPFRLRYATEGMERLSGYTREELLDMVQMDIVHENDVASLTEEVGRQLALSDTFEVEYRLKRKDGSFVYVLDRAKVVEHDNGQKYVHCILTDITQLKSMEQALRLSEEKYKIAMQQNGYAILEYDPATRALQCSENYTQIFGDVLPCGTLEDFALSSNVAEAHAAPLMALFEKTVSENCSEGMELQVLGSSGRYIWCSLQLTPLTDAFGTLYAVVGCLLNIDTRKRRLEELTELSQKDGLTGTYNRNTMEALVNCHLNCKTNGGRGALMILDIDKFKNINDNYGHDVGDELLVSMMETIRAFLQPQDVLGRLGGDEFLIFVPDISDVQFLSHYAEHIVQGVREAFLCRRYAVTVSLGAALCVKDCGGFKNLYKQADMALYTVKRNGRNGFHIHS